MVAQGPFIALNGRCNFTQRVIRSGPSIKRPKKSFLRLVYLFFDQCFFTQIIHVIRATRNFVKVRKKTLCDFQCCSNWIISNKKFQRDSLVNCIGYCLDEGSLKFLIFHKMTDLYSQSSFFQHLENEMLNNRKYMHLTNCFLSINKIPIKNQEVTC